MPNHNPGGEEGMAMKEDFVDDYIGRLISAALNGVDQPTPAMNEFIDELMSQEPPLTEEEESALADRVRQRFLLKMQERRRQDSWHSASSA